MRMLIMEGDGQIRRLLLQLLVQKGHEVESEADGLRGWDLFHFNPGRFDSLLVNAKMPRLTRIELLRRVREKDSELPAAISCNYGRLERVLPALELNLRAVLPFPFQMNQLDEVLKLIGDGANVEKTTLMLPSLNGSACGVQQAYCPCLCRFAA